MNDIINTETETLRDTETTFSGDKLLSDEVIPDKTDFLDGESSERTLRRSLAAYEIGKKLRQLRMKKKIALVDLGKTHRSVGVHAVSARKWQISADFAYTGAHRHGL